MIHGPDFNFLGLLQYTTKQKSTKKHEHCDYSSEHLKTYQTGE